MTSILPPFSKYHTLSLFPVPGYESTVLLTLEKESQTTWTHFFVVGSWKISFQREKRLFWASFCPTLALWTSANVRSLCLPPMNYRSKQTNVSHQIDWDGVIFTGTGHLSTLRLSVSEAKVQKGNRVSGSSWKGLTPKQSIYTTHNNRRALWYKSWLSFTYSHMVIFTWSSLYHPPTHPFNPSIHLPECCWDKPECRYQLSRTVPWGWTWLPSYFPSSPPNTTQRQKGGKINSTLP